MFRRLRTIAATLAALAILVSVVVLDAQLVADVYERSPAATAAAVAAAAAAILATVLGAVWLARRRERLSRRVRRSMAAFAIAWGVLFVIAVGWTHGRDRDAEEVGPVEAGVVAYVVLVFVTAVGFMPIWAFRQSRREHQPDDWVHVAYISDKQPFCVAYCDCGWVGEAHDDDEPDACERAFRDAREHGANVAPEIERPYG